MNVILNLTQHVATHEQVAQGVVDLNKEDKALLVNLLTVEEAPSQAEIEERCNGIALLADAIMATISPPDQATPTQCMIGGAPWMMSELERALRGQSINPVYSFSRRESVEMTLPDGTVEKTMVFRHAGWVYPPDATE